MTFIWKRLRLWTKLAHSYIANNRRSFVIGVLVSLGFIFLFPRYSPYIFKKHIPAIGIVGDFTIATLPRVIQEEISYGLVKLDANDMATSAAGVSWTSTDSGKTLEFVLNSNALWQDKENLTADQINYNLKGVDISKDGEIIRFSMKDPFAPLLTLLSQPLFKNGLVGLGDNKVSNIDFTGRFLSSISLHNTKTNENKVYKFYSSDKNLISALKLGAIDQIAELYTSYDLDKNPSYIVTSSIKTNVEAILFFNNQKHPFEDKSFRQGLVYALPDNFPQGETAESPFRKNSWAISSASKKYVQNLENAKKYVSKIATTSSDLKITISTTKQLEETASIIASAWSSIGIPTDIIVANTPDQNYDVYLSFIDLPPDPDQYALWHSTQTGNIAGYKSFKVDKLLEEGRRTTDIAARKDIYANFVKAITEDVPVAFLYYPRVYSIGRAP